MTEFGHSPLNEQGNAIIKRLNNLNLSEVKKYSIIKILKW